MNIQEDLNRAQGLASDLEIVDSLILDVELAFQKPAFIKKP